MKLVETRRHQVVVIVTAGVPGYRTGLLATSIREADYDRRRNAAKWESRIATLPGSARQVTHLAGEAPAHPFVEVCGGLHRPERRDPNQIEAKAIRLRLEELGVHEGLSRDSSHSFELAQRA
jgi:hypothetical protein